MSLIILSSDTTAFDQQIAQRTAKKLDYQLLGPEILPAIAAKNNLPAEKFKNTLEKSPSPLWRSATKQWLLSLACIEAEVLDRLGADNIVCWGLAAHLYVLGVSHALKVRLLSDAQTAVREIADQRRISAKKAEKWIEKEKRKQEQWAQTAFGQNEADAAMYDLVINLGQIDPDEAVSTITAAVAYRKFQPMTYSVKSLAESALAAKVKAKLLTTMTDIRVEARDGRVKVTTKALKRERQKKAAAIKEMAGTVDGVEFVEVHLINYVIREAAEGYR
jgi:cytidylate kinase